MFDTLNHALLFAKLNAYEFSENAIAYIKSYLSNRFKEPTNSTLGKISQGSVLGLLIFNIFINDVLLC